MHTQLLFQVLLGLIITVFTALLTYYFTTRGREKVFADIAALHITQHCKIYHRENYSDLVMQTDAKFEKIRADMEAKTAKFEKTVSDIYKLLTSIRIAQSFLVGKFGGKDLDMSDTEGI